MFAPGSQPSLISRSAFRIVLLLASFSEMGDFTVPPLPSVVWERIHSRPKALRTSGLTAQSFEQDGDVGRVSLRAPLHLDATTIKPLIQVVAPITNHLAGDFEVRQSARVSPEAKRSRFN
jgi:hypothetical protein